MLVQFSYQNVASGLCYCLYFKCEKGFLSLKAIRRKKCKKVGKTDDFRTSSSGLKIRSIRTSEEFIMTTDAFAGNSFGHSAIVQPLIAIGA